MTKSFLSIFILLNVNLSTAQQIPLTGQVSILNSKYNTGKIEYVKDAYVSSPFTKPDDTDDNGIFHMEFVGIKEGVSIQLNVEKPGFEVVNKRDLLDVVIGRKTTFRVFLAPKGQLALAQTELYQVNIKSLTARYDQTIKRLRQEGAESRAAISQLEEQLGRTIANRFEAEELLNEQLASLKKRLPEIAVELASANLDFASDMYRKAYEYFKAGEIEKTIEALDETKLDAEAKDVINNIAQLDSNISNLDTAHLFVQKQLSLSFESYRLKARSFLKNLQPREALTQYENALKLLQENPDGRHQELADTYEEAAAVYRENGNTQKALEYLVAGIQTKEAYFGVGHSKIIPAYQLASAAFQETGNLDAAIYYGAKACEAIQKEGSASEPALKSATEHLAVCYEQRGLKNLSQEKQTEAIEDFQQLLAYQPARKDIQKIIKKLKKIDKP
ncbi:MAG: tetratricopeptide repeat protein [Saprospiraceae bacterium]